MDHVTTASPPHDLNLADRLEGGALTAAGQAPVPQPTTVEVHRLPVPSDIRYEIKFVADVTDLHAVLSWVTAHPAGFAMAHPDRIVNNAYMDTPDLCAYEDNIAGISDREKVRYRWYGDHCHPASGVLEIKCRSDSAGWKWNAPVEHPVDLDTMTWQQFRDVLRANIGPAYRFLLDSQSMVTVVNRYRRNYFVSRDGKLRLTVDRNIQVFPQIGRTRPALRFAGHKVDALVIEVKCLVEHRFLAAEALADVRWRASRHSKYAVGIASLANL